MRLINADKLVEKLKKYKFEHEDMNVKINNIGNNILHEAIPQIIENEPIAFDKEKVLEELEEDLENYEYGLDDDYYLAGINATKKHIEIVKRGGLQYEID